MGRGGGRGGVPLIWVLSVRNVRGKSRCGAIWMFEGMGNNNVSDVEVETAS